MTALVTEHLPIVASAANGVKKLRELILQLAVMGKLVPQDPNDEPALQLLRRVGLPLKSATQREPSCVPACWCWTTIEHIAVLKSGLSLPAELELPKGEYLYIKVSDMNLSGNEIEITRSSRYVSKFSGIEDKLIPANSIVFPKRGGAIATNKKRLVRSPLLVDSNVMAMSCPEWLDVQYLYRWFLSVDLWKLNSGTSVPQINNKDILPLNFPLPPLAEQRRIVAKVDELMALCDRLDAQQSDAEAAHKQLVKALLDTLTQCIEQAEFATSWERIKQNFDTIFTTESSIDALKQTLLQLAVMGKLVPQDPNDEPASELLKKIQATKNRLVQDGKFREPSSVKAEPTNQPVSCLPSNWSISCLQDVFDVRDGTHDSPKYLPLGIPLVTSKNLYFGNLDMEDVNFISEKDYQKISERSGVSRGDVLFAMIGHSIGNAAMVDVDAPFAIKNVALFKKYSSELTNMRYLLLYLRARVVDFKATSSGGAQSFISLSKLRVYQIFLPPLAEQHRIVAKVDELMSICDSLKNSLSKARAHQELLSAVIVEQATNSDMQPDLAREETLTV